MIHHLLARLLQGRGNHQACAGYRHTATPACAGYRPNDSPACYRPTATPACAGYRPTASSASYWPTASPAVAGSSACGSYPTSILWTWNVNNNTISLSSPLDSLRLERVAFRAGGCPVENSRQHFISHWLLANSKAYKRYLKATAQQMTQIHDCSIEVF